MTRLWIVGFAMALWGAQDPPPLSKLRTKYSEAYARQNGKARGDLAKDFARHASDPKGLEALCWIASTDPDETVRIEAVRNLRAVAGKKECYEVLSDAVLGGHIPDPKKKLWDPATRGGGATPALRREIGALFHGGVPPELIDRIDAVLKLKDPPKPKKGTAPDLQLHSLQRALAAELLGEISGEAAAKRLEAARGDADPVVRLAVAQALGRTYHPAARGPLKNWPNADDPLLKAEIETALKRLDAWELKNPPKKGDDGTVLVPPPPAEETRLTDTAPTFEMLFLVDVGHGMKGILPSVLRIAKREIEALRKKSDRPIRAAVLTVQNETAGPVLELAAPMTPDLESVITVLGRLEVKQKTAPKPGGMFGFEASLRAAAHRLGWSRNSEKRLFAFTADGGLSHAVFTRQTAADLKTLEFAELVIYHTAAQRPVPETMEEIAKAGGGRAEKLSNSVPPEITVVLRGGAAADKKTIQKIFHLKRDPTVVSKASGVYEARFLNEDSLDADALSALEVGVHPGLTDLVLVNPVLSASKALTYTLEITVQGKNNPAVNQAYSRAILKPYEVKGLASAVVGFPLSTNPNAGDDPQLMVTFRATALMMVRADVSEADLKRGFAECGFTVK